MLKMAVCSSDRGMPPTSTAEHHGCQKNAACYADSFVLYKGT
jgi:hypothetical protein